jgi:hypothetical protein
VRTAWRNANEAALAYCAGSNEARKRNTQIPGGNASACRSIPARISRRIRLRVTERRTYRFGTTMPSQNPPGSAFVTAGVAGREPREAASSTATVHREALPVDN